MRKMRFLKILRPDRGAPTRPGFRYPPIGQWAPPITGEVIPCQNGYHVFTMQAFQRWYGAYGVGGYAVVYEVEVRGRSRVSGLGKATKYAVQEVRLIRRLLPARKLGTGWITVREAECHVREALKRTAR